MVECGPYEPQRKKGEALPHSKQSPYAKGKMAGKQGTKKGFFAPTGESPPRCDQRDRDTFRQLHREDPDTLRQYLAFSVLEMPGAGQQELGKMFSQCYGALITEACHLFGHRDLTAAVCEIRENYRMPQEGAWNTDNLSDDLGSGGHNMAASSLTSRLKGSLQGAVARVFPISASEETQTDPWIEKLICDCNRTVVVGVPVGKCRESSNDERGSNELGIIRMAPISGIQGGQTSGEMGSVRSDSVTRLSAQTPQMVASGVVGNQLKRTLVPPAGMPMPVICERMEESGSKDGTAKKGGFTTLAPDPTEGPSDLICHSEMRVSGTTARPKAQLLGTGGFLSVCPNKETEEERSAKQSRDNVVPAGGAEPGSSQELARFGSC